MPLVRHDPDLRFGPSREERIPDEPCILTDADYETVIGRKPALPLYFSPTELLTTDSTVGYLPGRVVLQSMSGEEHLFRSDLFDLVCPQDVLFSFLFQPCESADPVPLVPMWKRLRRAIRDVGPQVYAVLVGNVHAETRFDRMLRAETDECRTESVRRLVEFVKRAGGILRDWGARPAFGIVSPQIILHAYWADQHLPGGDPLLPVLRDMGALVISFSGCPEWWASREEFWPQHGKQRTYQWYAQNEDLDEWPFQRIINWVSAVECWAGVEYLAGLQAGNDLKLAAGGFRAGVIGELPDGSR